MTKTTVSAKGVSNGSLLVGPFYSRQSCATMQHFWLIVFDIDGRASGVKRSIEVNRWRCRAICLLQVGASSGVQSHEDEIKT